MDRKPWNRRHFLYGISAGTCIGVILATALYTSTADQMYIILIPIGFIIGSGLGATRCLMDGRRRFDDPSDKGY